MIAARGIALDRTTQGSSTFIYEVKPIRSFRVVYRAIVWKLDAATRSKTRVFQAEYSSEAMADLAARSVIETQERKLGKDASEVKKPRTKPEPAKGGERMMDKAFGRGGLSKGSELKAAPGINAFVRTRLTKEDRARVTPGILSKDANYTPAGRRAVGSRQSKSIHARLKRHSEIMLELIGKGMEREAASNSAMEQLLAEEKQRGKRYGMDGFKLTSAGPGSFDVHTEKGAYAGTVAPKPDGSYRVYFNMTATKGSERKFPHLDAALDYIRERRLKKGWSV